MRPAQFQNADPELPIRIRPQKISAQKKHAPSMSLKIILEKAKKEVQARPKN
jgi:hypothetical protein